MARLGDIFTISSGGTPDKRQTKYYENGTIPWVKTGDLKGKYVPNNVELITQEGLENSSAKLFPADTVLVAMYGATIGACSILDFEASTNQACAAFLPTPKVIPDYLYYFLNSKKDIFIQNGVGGAQPNISAGYLKKFLFDEKSLDEQKKIVSVLDKVSDLVSLRKQQLAKLDELVKARFVEMFGDVENRQFLRTVANVTGGLTKNSKRNSFPMRLPYLRVANVFYDNIDTTEILEIGLTQEEKDKTLLQYGDLLFVEGNGSPDQIGRVAIWRNEVVPCVHQNHLIKVRFDELQVLPVYAMHYFMSPKGREQIKSKAVSTSGLYTLSVSKIESLTLPIAPIELQKQFSSFTERANKQKLTIQQSLDHLEMLKKSLMQEYFM